MKTNLKATLSTIGIAAALLASPATAKTVRHHYAEPSTVYIPNDASGSVARYGYGSFDNPVEPVCHDSFGFCR